MSLGIELIIKMIINTEHIDDYIAGVKSSWPILVWHATPKIENVRTQTKLSRCGLDLPSCCSAKKSEFHNIWKDYSEL